MISMGKQLVNIKNHQAREKILWDIVIMLIILICTWGFKSWIWYNLDEGRIYQIVPNIINIVPMRHITDYLRPWESLDGLKAIVTVIVYTTCLIDIERRTSNLKSAENKVLALSIITVSIIATFVATSVSETIVFIATILIIILGYKLIYRTNSKTSETKQKIVRIQLIAQISGVCGNMLESWFRGYVIDMFNIQIKIGSLIDLRSWIFNIEDILCIIGRALMIIILVINIFEQEDDVSKLTPNKHYE